VSLGRCDQRVLVLVLVGVEHSSGLSHYLSFLRVPLGASVSLSRLSGLLSLSSCIFPAASGMERWFLIESIQLNR